MSLKGPFVGLEGNGTGGIWIGDKTEYFTATRVNQLRQEMYMSAAGTFHRSVPIGGSRSRGLRYLGAIDVVDAVHFEIDNTSNYVGSSSGLVVPITVWARVESALLAVTPRIFNVTTNAVATTSGSLACVGTAEDYSGTGQKQTLLLTLPTGLNVFKLQLVSSGGDYQFWGQGWRSLYF